MKRNTLRTRMRPHPKQYSTRVEHFSTAKRQWLEKKQARQARINKLEKDLAGALEQIKELEEKATSLMLEAREY